MRSKVRSQSTLENVQILKSLEDLIKLLKNSTLLSDEHRERETAQKTEHKQATKLIQVNGTQGVFFFCLSALVYLFLIKGASGRQDLGLMSHLRGDISDAPSMAL
ncbi:hypothetical protein chiPu_0002170 [Chiloscyllium punctatum]|uniref:Uncharacterized protein n=1 Tax=Chiloscyllium punctatum TaxID=137246 RepID=A0A401S044_CHIPU|nr:hypothetical protein [Chiloscyllium punctatum]